MVIMNIELQLKNKHKGARQRNHFSKMWFLSCSLLCVIIVRWLNV